MNEDDTIEVISMGNTVHTLHVGIDYALAKVRGDYIDGRCDADHLERETERLLRKQHDD